jgi:hypothetical protein
VSRGEVVGPVVDTRLVGYPDEVANALRTMHERGDLAEVPQQAQHLRDGRVAVNVRVIDRTRPVRHRSHRRWVAIGVASGTAVTAGVVYLVYLAVTALLAHLALILGTGALMLLLGWVGAGQAGACPGLHCPGCKCHR